MSKPVREQGPKPAYNVHVYNFRVLTTYVLILSLFCVCVCVHSFVLLVRNRICDDIPVNSKPMFFICFFVFFPNRLEIACHELICFGGRA